jgi:hypothetical protein
VYEGIIIAIIISALTPMKNGNEPKRVPGPMSIPAIHWIVMAHQTTATASVVPMTAVALLGGLRVGTRHGGAPRTAGCRGRLRRGPWAPGLGSGRPR